MTTLLLLISQKTSRTRFCLFGQMYQYTKELWQPIVEELAGITEKTLITVATEEEAKWVQEWAAGVGRYLEISENDRDPIYDRWVIFG